MAYIYKIENDINGKIYIGKTEFSIEKRFKEHCTDAFRERSEKRPLYAAIRKYGVEHFHISLIEETDSPNEREVYWISYYDSYNKGYNCTKGGQNGATRPTVLSWKLENEVIEAKYLGFSTKEIGIAPQIPAQKSIEKAGFSEYTDW